VDRPCATSSRCGQPMHLALIRAWTAGLYLLATLLLPTMASAEDMSQAEARRAKSNNACAQLGAAYLTAQERQHAAEMGQWTADCNQNPQRSVCEDTAELIQGAGKTSPLHCVGVADATGPAPAPTINPNLSPIEKLNQACARIGGTFASNTERQHAAEMAQWVADCNRHPTRSTCDDTAELIQDMGKKSPLNCAGG